MKLASSEGFDSCYMICGLQRVQGSTETFRLVSSVPTWAGGAEVF